jgi:hypothetical protein
VSRIASELAAIAFFVVSGWAALWPMRRRIGPFAYHLAALPVGLLAAPLAGSVSTVTGRPLDAISAAAGAILLVAALWIVQRLVLDREAPVGAPAVGIRSFAAAAGGVGLLGALFGAARFTIWNNDSFMSYWPLAVELSRKGAFDAQLMSSRSPLLPAMGAIHATFGSDWAYVIYTMMGATVAFWMAWTLWTGPLAGLKARTKAWLTGATVTFLIIEPSFIFQSFMVHSHMVSAMYLLLSVTCIWFAARDDGLSPGDTGNAFLVIAGACAAGLALSRPDGPAYVFVPIAAALAALTLSKVDGRQVAAFFAPLLFVFVVPYAATYLRIGVWVSNKLSGRLSLAILVLLAASAAGPWIVQYLDRRLPWRVSGERFLPVLASAATVVMLIVFAVKWETAIQAVATTAVNLFLGAGGYSYLWWGVLAVLLVSVWTRDAVRVGSWTRPAFFTVMVFLIVAGIIHGSSHAGRVGPGDSLNRVMFHLIPLAVWYASALAARVLGTAQDEEKA